MAQAQLRRLTLKEHLSIRRARLSETGELEAIRRQASGSLSNLRLAVPVEVVALRAA
jgi:hypothetical protein